MTLQKIYRTLENPTDDGYEVDRASSVLENSADRVRQLYADALPQIEDLAASAKAPNTLKGYASDWATFTAWAKGKGVDVPLASGGVGVPPALVMAYLNESQGVRKPATMSRHLSAIRFWHHENGLASPTEHPKVRQLMAGFSRAHAETPDRAAPLYLADLKAGLPKGNSAKAVRDRAILLVGWWSALRRSELVALNWDDLGDHPEGIVLTVRKSKTDQTAQGAFVPIHYRKDIEICPVRALRALKRPSDTSATVFEVSGRTVSRIVKRAAQRAGLDPEDYSAHSLRSGFVSECDRRQIPSGAVRSVTRHTSDAMLSVYQRPGSLFRDSAGAYFDNGESPDSGKVETVEDVMM